MGLKRWVCDRFVMDSQMEMGLERSHQKYTIVYIKPLIQASAFVSWQEFKDCKHLCGEIGHTFNGISRYFRYH